MSHFLCETVLLFYCQTRENTDAQADGHLHCYSGDSAGRFARLQSRLFVRLSARLLDTAVHERRLSPFLAKLVESSTITAQTRALTGAVFFETRLRQISKPAIVAY